MGGERGKYIVMASIPPFFYLIIALMRKDRRTQIEMRLNNVGRFFLPSVKKKNKNNLEEFMCALSQLFLSRLLPPPCQPHPQHSFVLR